MSDIFNPYIAGNPVIHPEMFFGRDDVFQFIRQSLIGQHRDNVIVLYGQRRTGKTSVLYQLPARLDARYLCIFMDLHGFSVEGQGVFLWELMNHILRILERNYQIDLTAPNRTEFMTDPRDSFASTFLNRVWSAIGDRHLLLMLDEAVRLQEQVEAGKLEPEIFAYMRHLMQHYERLNFLFSLGSGLEEMEKDYTFLFNVVLYKKITFLDPDAAYALITQPVKDYYRIEPAAVERIIHITSGHPYYIQLLCHSLFNRWQQKQGSHIEIRDVDEILDEVVERGLAVLKHVWDESTAGEKAVMAGMSSIMSKHDAPVKTKAINRNWKAHSEITIPKGEMSIALKSLITRDIIDGQGQYLFRVVLQRLWVQKYKRPEWVKEEIATAIRDWTPTSTNAHSSISRRKVLVGLVGLGLAGVVSGVAWLVHPLLFPPPILPPGTTLYTYKGHSKTVYGVAWSPDGTRIASASADRSVHVWDPVSGTKSAPPYSGNVHGEVYGVDWSPDSTRIVCASADETAQVFSSLSALYEYALDLKSTVYDVSWSPRNDHGRHIATASANKTVHVWDAGNTSLRVTYKHRDIVYAVMWSYDGTHIASAAADKTVQVWHVPSDIDLTVQVWDAATQPKNVLVYNKHTETVYDVAWSHDGTRIASAGGDKTVQIWDATTGCLLFTYPHHTDTVYAVDWSPDDKRIASASWDRTVHLWDALTGLNVLIYKRHTDKVYDVAWSYDGTRIASTGGDKTVRIWKAV